jgi:hypothetical protein
MRHRPPPFVALAKLIAEIDAQVGSRNRNQFIQEAVEEKLRRQRLKASLAEMAGSLADVDIPGWEASEAAAEWVRALRSGCIDRDACNIANHCYPAEEA